MKVKLVSIFLIVFIIAGAFGQESENDILKELQSIRGILQSITEPDAPGRLVPMTIEMMNLCTSLGTEEFQKLGIYLSSNLVLTRRPDRTQKVVNGTLVIDNGHRIETVTVPQMSRGIFGGWLVDEKTNKMLVIVNFPELGHILYFTRNPYTDRYEFYAAEGITYENYQGPSPHLYIFMNQKGTAYFPVPPAVPAPHTIPAPPAPPPAAPHSMHPGANVEPRRGDYFPVYLMDRGRLSKEEIVSYIMQKSTAMTRQQIDLLITLYINEALIEGINHDIAVAQLCYATRFFSNHNLMSTFNYAGLNADSGISVLYGGRHANMNQGVRAHIQHLKGYASREPLKNELIDLRYNSLVRSGHLGTARTLDELYLKWSPNNAQNYGNEINRILRELYQFSGR